MIEERTVDTAGIVREIEAEVERRRQAGEYPARLLEALHTDFSIPEEDEPPELLAVVNTVHPVTSHRQPRKLIINAKKTIRRLVAWYIQPMALDQTRFNYSILQEVRSLERRLIRVETPWRRAPRQRGPERPATLVPFLERAGADPVLVLGDDGGLVAALREHGICVLEPPEATSRSVHDHPDPIMALERAAPSSLGGIVLAGMLPRLSAAELLAVVPLAAHALKIGGLLVADAPDPRNPRAAPDPSAVDPAMIRWVTAETISLLCEAAGLHPVADVAMQDGVGAGWRAVIASRRQAVDGDG